MQKMVEQEKILEAWIMVEHLSEGDINIRDKEVLMMEKMQGQDFYSFFLEKMREKSSLKEKSGIVIYFDIFDFQKEVISILRRQYNLKPTDEELRAVQKFSFALYFDRELILQKKMTFFTESGYIRYHEKVPCENEFRKFESSFNDQLEKDFDETAEDQQKFNEAMQEVLHRFKIKVENCRIRILKDVEKDATNLHSFFIDDLEEAKKISNANLKAYQLCRKTPDFSHGDIRHVHRIYASN